MIPSTGFTLHSGTTLMAKQSETSSFLSAVLISEMGYVQTRLLHEQTNESIHLWAYLELELVSRISLNDARNLVGNSSLLVWSLDVMLAFLHISL